jgi:hypothetical protein
VFLWYLVLLAAALALWFGRRQLTLILPIACVVALGILVLAVTEGNVGTLYRHRAMIIPAAATLAAPVLAGVLSWMREVVRP